MRAAIFSILIATWASAAKAHDPRAHYLGNEGVMVASGDTKILFDAFFDNSYGQYALVPEPIATAMLGGDPPYDGIDAIFVSHVHGDHFASAPAVEYLRAHPGVVLYASIQIRSAILDAGVSESDPVFNQIRTFDLKPKDAPLSFTIGALEIEAVAIPHSGNWATLQNFAWRITIDDAATVMHLGDAGAVLDDYERHAGYFAARKTDAAFPPFWLFMDETGRAILKQYIAADHTIGIHVPERAKGNGDAWRAEIGGDLFTDPGETRDIAPVHLNDAE